MTAAGNSLFFQLRPQLVQLLQPGVIGSLFLGKLLALDGIGVDILMGHELIDLLIACFQQGNRFLRPFQFIFSFPLFVYIYLLI